MPRKRKRKLNPGPIVFLLLLCSVGVGLSYSPITAVTKVRIVGAEPFDRPRLEGIMSGLAGTPCVKVNPRAVESAALQIPEALDADFARNILGHAELRMKYREPVARLEGHPDQLLDSQGTLYSSRQVVGVLPTLRVPPEGLQPNVSFVNSWPSRTIAKFCSDIPRQLPREGMIVEVLARGELCLTAGPSVRIVFGAARQLDQKVEALNSLLTKNPQLLSGIKELNLSAASHPVVVPAAKELKP